MERIVKTPPTGSVEKIGPSGTFLTVKELCFCQTKERARQHLAWRATTGTDAEKEPLEIGRHREVVRAGCARR